MDYGYEIQRLKTELDSLREAFLQSQMNQVSVTNKADNAANAVEQITPTTYTKTAYIGDTEVIFDNIPSGQITVHAEDSEGHFPIFDMDKNGSTLTIYFEPLQNVAVFTVSIL